MLNKFWGFLERIEVDSVFYLFDSDRTGTVNREKFLNGCNRLGIHPKNLSYGDIFDLIKVKGNVIEYTDFKNAATGKFVRFYFFLYFLSSKFESFLASFTFLFFVFFENVI
jgi:Ca2+-binding EF-hand superfamily protein